MIVYRFGPFRLEKEQLLLSLEDTPLALGPKVVETLLALVEHPGEVLGKAELLDRIWPEGFVEEANLAQNIYVIRKTLRAYWERNVIETVPRRGYRFSGEATVERRQDAHAAQPAEVSPSSRARGRFAFAAAIAAVLAVAVGAGVVQVAAQSHTQAAATQGLSPVGTRLYAMGKFYWNQRSAASIAKSTRYFRAVIHSDPRDSRGYAGLASSYAIAGDYGFDPLSKKAALDRAAAYAREALSIDARSAEGHAVLGLVDVDNGKMAQGASEYRRAIALDPSYAPAHQWYGISLLMKGKIAQAYDELQNAANLDPESVAATDWLSQVAFISRRYKDAISYGHQALDLSPQRYGAYETIGMAYEALGNYHAAISSYEKYGSTCGYCRFDAAALLARVYALAHNDARAQQQLQQAQRGVALGQISPDNLVAALIAMGRKNDAFAMLRKAKSSEPAAMLAIDPRMDALRKDARFRQYTQGPG